MKILLLTAIIIISHLAFAEEPNLDDQEIINIENLYKNNQPQVVEDKKSELPGAQFAPIVEDRADDKNNTEKQKSAVSSLTDLNKLAPFSDISVIQKKFLPKTNRFQFFAAGGLTTNSPWFNNLGLKLNLGYHMTESFGLEGSVMLFNNSESEAAKEIRSNNNLQPNKFVITKSNMGLDLIWSPIYGKIATLDQTIIPFDMYFSLGGGTSATNSQEGSVPTFHVGTGQIFALSKSMAFRWDYSWNFYQATPEVDASATSLPSQSNYNDLIFTAGVSFFFPEAKYR